MLKKILILPIVALILSSCTKSEEPAPAPAPGLPEITEMAGGIVKVKASDDFLDFSSEQVKFTTNVTVDDGTMFRVVSEELLISVDKVDYIKDMLVPSVDGKVEFAIKPSQTPGLYRISIYPVATDKIKFKSNLTARYFVEVLPGDPFIIQNISSERFEDLSPYNGVKELNESWIISANPSLLSYISVGPIQDKFGNAISEGSIELVFTEGSLVSPNPALISDGYAYFSYKPTSSVADITFTANLIGVEGIALSKSVLMKLVKPHLEFSVASGDFSNMTEGEVREIALTLKNTGSQISTNLNLSITPPFILLPEQSDSCKSTQTLRSQESCLVRVRYTRQANISQNGYLQVVGQPSDFISSTTILPLIVSNSTTPQLILSQSNISFPQTACGQKSILDIFVTNTGSTAAMNASIIQPPASVAGQSPYFKIILPPANMSNPDVNSIIDCGESFPAGRKCRIRLEYDPKTIDQTTPVSGVISATGVPNLSITMNGSAIAGAPTGSLPVNFLTSGSLLPTTSMLAATGQRTIVRVGPLTDICSNPVGNGTVISANVSGGELSSMITTTNNGFADFTWNAQSKPELIGTQTINITSSGFSKQASLLFQGINLTLSGETNWGEVIIQKPQDKIYTVQNSGNITAENIQFVLSTPLIKVDETECLSIPANSSCSVTIGARPLANQDYPSLATVSSTTAGINQSTLNNILVVGRSKPVLSLDSNSYLFNDGLTSGIVARTLMLTNNGPATSKLTTIAIEPPYSISSTNCPTTLGVQQSCQINVVANRSSSLAAGNKKIIISNEVDEIAFEATLSFGQLRFSQQDYNFKKHYCTGPLTISSFGVNNELKALNTNTDIALSSATGNVFFYSESTCNEKITSTTILAEQNTSAQFYVRSFMAEENTLTGTYGSFPVAERFAVFQSIENDFLAFKPALAVKNLSCVLCHSSVKGNIVTDMNFTNGSGHFYGYPNSLGPNGSGISIDTGALSTSKYGANEISFGTSYIEGTIYVPKLTIEAATRSYVESIFSAGRGLLAVSTGVGSGQSLQQIFKGTVPFTNILTVADHLNSAIIYRTPTYLNFLLNWGGGLYAKDSTISPTIVAIREVPSVNISWPTPNKITSFLDSAGTMKYYPWTPTAPALTNFGEIDGKYFGNIDKAQNVICEGDIFVDGIVVLNELKLETVGGCRIYATKSVFIQAPNSNVANRVGVQYMGEDTTLSNLQISSSKAIMMGLGQCPNVATYYPSYSTDKGAVYSQKYGMMGYRSSYEEHPEFGLVLTEVMPDYDKVTDINGNGILYDAAGPIGGCSPSNNATYANNRKVDFTRLLLNAPRIDSRYTGNFSGSIITGTSIWSLGKFSYKYDAVLNQVPILPLLTPETFFSVQDCVVNGVDNATQKDSNYKVCPSN